jgi:hypothetical protein
MVGRKDISIPNHQKKRVAGSSNCFATSRHFFELLVKILAMRLTGVGMILAAI